MKTKSVKGWTALQDTLLLQAVESHQDRWLIISNAIPGRSATECAQRYHDLQSLQITTLSALQAHHQELAKAHPVKVKRTFVPQPSLFSAVPPPEALVKPKPKSRRKSVAPASTTLKENANAKSRPASRPLERVPLQDQSHLVEREALSEEILPTQSITAAQLMSDLAFSPPAKHSDRGIYSDPILGHETCSPFRPASESKSTSCHPGISLDDLFSGHSPIHRRETLDFLKLIPNEHALKPEMPVKVKMEPNLGYPLQSGNLYAPSLHGSSKLRPPVPNYPLPQISNHPPYAPISNNLMVSQKHFASGPSMSRGIMDELFPQTRASLSTSKQKRKPRVKTEPHMDMDAEMDIETRHEYSTVKIPRSEVDALFEESLDVMADGEKMMMMPTFCTTEPEWIDSKDQKMCVQQLGMLKQQLSEYLQLTVQAFAIVKELKGPDDKDTMYWRTELENQVLMSTWGKEHMGDETVFNVPGLDLVSQLFDIPSDSNSVKSQAFATSMKASVRPKIKARFLESKDSPNNSAKKKTKTLQFAELPASVVQSIDLFKGIFKPQLKPTIIHVVQSELLDFSTLETDLFYAGLLQYGLSDFATIRALFLPTKTVTQLKMRFNNAKYRKPTKGMEKIYNLWLQPFKPLVVNERELIIEGYRKYGKRFRVMVKTSFSTYPLSLLKQVWDELVLLGEIDIPWLMPKVEEPIQRPVIPKDLPYRRPILKKPPSSTYMFNQSPMMHHLSSTPARHSDILSSAFETPFISSSTRLNFPQPIKTMIPFGFPRDNAFDDIFTDTGSVYNPTSDWDWQPQREVSKSTPAPTRTTMEDDINYNDFLETIFEMDAPAQANEEEEEQDLTFENDDDEEEFRPKVSLSGAYDLASSEAGDELGPLLVEDMDSFFSFHQEGNPLLGNLLSPERRVTRSCSRITTANNSAQKLKASPCMLNRKKIPLSYKGAGRKGARRRQSAEGTTDEPGQAQKKRRLNHALTSSQEKARLKRGLRSSENPPSASLVAPVHLKRKSTKPTPSNSTFELLVYNRNAK